MYFQENNFFGEGISSWKDQRSEDLRLLRLKFLRKIYRTEHRTIPIQFSLVNLSRGGCYIYPRRRERSPGVYSSRKDGGRLPSTGSFCSRRCVNLPASRPRLPASCSVTAEAGYFVHVVNLLNEMSSLPEWWISRQSAVLLTGGKQTRVALINKKKKRNDWNESPNTNGTSHILASRNSFTKLMDQTLQYNFIFRFKKLSRRMTYLGLSKIQLTVEQCVT